MTEKEAWLKIGRKCLRVRGALHWVFLCNEVGERSPLSMRVRMRERLELFEPPELVRGTVWWGGYEDNDGSTTAELNGQRALACGFLAAMAEEEEG